MRPLIEPDHPDLSVRRQCELLGLPRASLYYQPAAETADNLRLMGLIDREYTEHPSKGSRTMTAWLRRQGEAWQADLLTLLDEMAALYQAGRLLAVAPGHAPR